MADGALGELIPAGTTSGILNGLVTILVALVGLALVGIAAWVWFHKYKVYKQYKCVIFHKDAFGQVHTKFDDAGIFVDSKTKNKRLFLRKNNVGLDPDNVPFVGTGKNKTIYLLQTGLKNFQYIRIKIPDTGVRLTVGEEDVNWAINAYERQKKLFSDSKWLQLLPFIAIAFVSIIILVIFIYFFKNFDVLKDVAQALKDTAIEMAKTHADSVVIQGGVAP